MVRIAYGYVAMAVLLLEPTQLFEPPAPRRVERRPVDPQPRKLSLALQIEGPRLEQAALRPQPPPQFGISWVHRGHIAVSGALLESGEVLKAIEPEGFLSRERELLEGPCRP